MNGGLSLYSGITGGNRLLNSLNMTQFGIEHTGQIGDSTLGSFFHKKKWPTGMYSQRLRSRRNYQEISCDFSDLEIYLIYTRGFQGAVNTHMIRRNYTEVCSPFLDVEFLQLCMDIPAGLRSSHKLYKKWILQKHPQAAQFKWEKVDAKITDPNWLIFLKKIVKKGPQKLLRLLGHYEKISSGISSCHNSFR